MSNKRIHQLPDAGNIDRNQSFPVEKTDGTGTTGRQTIGRLLDKAQQTAGLKPWAARPYLEGECALINGEIRQFAPIGSDGSEFYPEEWILVGKKPSQYGYPDYEPSQTYNTNDRVTFANRLWRQTNLESCTGISPLQVPAGATYWTEVSISEDRFGRDYDQALSDDGYEVVGLKGDVVRKVYRGELRLFEALFQNQTGAAYTSSAFDDEVLAGDWIEFAPSKLRSETVELSAPKILLSQFFEPLLVLPRVDGFAYDIHFATLQKISGTGGGTASNGNPLNIFIGPYNSVANGRGQMRFQVNNSTWAVGSDFLRLIPASFTDATENPIESSEAIYLNVTKSQDDYSDFDYKLHVTYSLLKV